MELTQKENSLRETVRRQLMDLIHQMDFSYSTRLLSENQLAAKFQVSRSTIRAVLTELETEGKLIRRQGSGTYVNPPALNVETTIHPRVNMYDLIRRNGYQPGLKVLHVQEERAGEWGMKLNLFPFEQIIEIYSIYYGDDKPCMYCIDRVDKKKYTAVNWMDLENMPSSIHNYIQMTAGININWDIIHIKAANSDQIPALREHFQVAEGTVKPFVHLEITNFDTANEPVLFGNIYVDCDKVELNIVRDLTKR